MVINYLLTGMILQVSTLLHDKINPKDCQVTLGDSGFLQFFRVVSSDYGKPRQPTPPHK